MNTLSYEKEADVNKHFYIIDFPDMKIVNYRFAGSHIHKSIEILVCYKGTMSYVVGKQKGLLHEGEILIINSFDYHFYEYVGNASCYILVISDDYSNDVLNNPNVEFNNLPNVDSETFGKIIQLIKPFYDRFEESSFINRKAFILSFFSLLEDKNLFRKKINIVDKDLCQQIINYIDLHYKEPLTISTVGKAFGYSTNYFSFIFNKCMGENFNSCLNRYRANKVSEFRKENPNISVEEAIYQMGFTSRETYYRFLRSNK